MNVAEKAITFQVNIKEQLIFADLYVCLFFFLNEHMTGSNLELGHTLRAAEVEDVPLWQRGLVLR